MRRAVLALGAVAALAGCGASHQPAALSAELLGPQRLPGLHAVTRRLAAQDVVLTTPVPGLRARLSAWGFRAAAEREFAGHTRLLSHVVSMGVDFAGTGGALAYQRLLLSRTDTYLGPGAKIVRMTTSGGEGWLITAQSCGCHPAPPTVIAVVRRQAHLSWLSVSGPGATPARARMLAATPREPSQPL